MNYVATAANVEKMLKKAGAPATVKSLTGSVYDPATLESSELFEELEASAVRDRYSRYLIDGDRFQASDVRLWVSCSAKIKPGDLVLFAGDTLKVIEADPIGPAGIVVIQDVHARGA